MTSYRAPIMGFRETWITTPAVPSRVQGLPCERTLCSGYLDQLSLRSSATDVTGLHTFYREWSAPDILELACNFFSYCFLFIQPHSIVNSNYVISRIGVMIRPLSSCRLHMILMNQLLKCYNA